MAVKQGVNDLYTWCLNNGEQGQRLLKEWQGVDDNGVQIDMHKVGTKSIIRVLWKCIDCGNEWYTGIAVRTRGSICLKCANKNKSTSMRKSAVKLGENDLETWCKNNRAYGEQILQEWTGIDKDNNQVNMNEIAFGSDLKVLWKCNKGHEWQAKIRLRTVYRHGCKYCNIHSTSYPEQFIYWTLKQLYPNTENRCRVLKSPENPKGIEFDIGVPDIPLCIEYSPISTHSDSEQMDKYKKEVCDQRGIRLIQIVDTRDRDSLDVYEDNYIEFCMIDHKADEILTEIMDYILKSIGHSISEIDLETVKDNAWKYSHGDIEYEKSLAYTHPELVKEWHPTLNTLKTIEVTHGNSKRAYWQCTQCGYGKNGEWLVTITSRASYKYGTGCPCCGYHWKDKKIHKTYNTIIVVGFNDLATTHPDLAKEWHPTLNTIKPTEIKYGSKKLIYWQCTKCGYGKDGKWQAPPSRRTVKGSETGCPQCKYKWFNNSCTVTKEIENSTPAINVNSIATAYPDLAKEWHPTLNQFKVTETTYGSGRKVFWQCVNCRYGKNGEWQAPPARRTTKGYETGCPCCGYHWKDKQIHKTYNTVALIGMNDLATTHPELAKEWHPTLNTLKPTEIKYGHSKTVYWQCINCNYGENGKWQATPNRRTSKGYETGCPQCGYNWHRATIGAPQRIKAKYRIDLD